MVIPGAELSREYVLDLLLSVYGDLKLQAEVQLRLRITNKALIDEHPYTWA
jgi:hypothetical protein